MFALLTLVQSLLSDVWWGLWLGLPVLTSSVSSVLSSDSVSGTGISSSALLVTLSCRVQTRYGKNLMESYKRPIFKIFLFLNIL